MSGEFVVNTLILFIIFLIILWLAGKIFFAVLFRVLRNKEAAAQKQILDDDISAEQMLLNLELVKNGVDVRKYDLYEYISMLPEYKSFITELQYLKEHISSLPELVTKDGTVLKAVSNTQILAHEMNSDFIKEQNKVIIQHDIIALLVGLLLIKEFSLDYAISEQSIQKN